MAVIGMDIHRSFAQAAFLQDGQVKREQRVHLVHDRLVRFGKSLSVEDEVVIEATGNSAAVERILRPFVKRVVVANPRMVRAIAYARVKTDKIDAAYWRNSTPAAFYRRSGLRTTTPNANGGRRLSVWAFSSRSFAPRDVFTRSCMQI